MMEYSFPKIDLHVHLDGSLPLKLAYALAQDRQLIDSPVPWNNSAVRSSSAATTTA